MAQCTAPVEGHRTASGRANCPACGRSYQGYSYGTNFNSPTRAYTPSPPLRYPSYAGRSSGGSSLSRSRRSSVTYSTREYQTLNPVREQIVRISQTGTDRRDLFLCHAWDDRKGVALDLHNLLTGLDVSVWFSEMDVPLGTSLIRKIDKGLASSNAGIVLVTPSLFTSLNSDGIAAQELSALLATDRVIPVVHGTTFDALRLVSPLLAARSGLDTANYLSLEEVATKIADTVLLD
jgi:hypothetical protein